jgi:hypothetical protein
VFILIFKKFGEIDSEIRNEMLVDAVYQNGATKIWCRSCGFYRASPYPVSITMMNFVIPTKQQLSPKPRRVRMPNLDMLLSTLRTIQSTSSESVRVFYVAENLRQK